MGRDMGGRLVLCKGVLWVGFWKDLLLRYSYGVLFWLVNGCELGSLDTVPLGKSK